MRLAAWIGSEQVRSADDAWIPSIDPSHPETTVAEVPVGGPADVDRAVAAASDAFSSWKGLSGPARSEALFAWADRIKARQDELALAIAREVGKPIGEARGEVGRCVAILRYYAGEAVRPMGEVVPAQTAGPLQYSLRIPMGVVGLITPWNFPLAIPLWKAAPALSMGNTVVLKPSEMSGFCASLLAETSAGLLAGVFNVVHGTGAAAGKALVGHADVRAVSFTGSVATGMAVQTACAVRNAKCQAEMGGKNAAVVLADADLDRAAGLVAAGAMRYAGQKCTATSRVIVVEQVFSAFLEKLVQQVDALQVGPVSEATTALGPVIDEAARDRLAAVLRDPQGDVVYRSKQSGDGFYVPPTIIGPVESGSSLAQDELFGPVLTLLSARDADHAVEIANATRFGLSTAVYTDSVAGAVAYIDKVEAGLVRVNGDTTGVDPHAPFGGTKASSTGTREQGTVAKDFYTEWKTVQINP
ncbi:MAG: aldehyde dehydrogenase family protein [Armatimonadetes bacterium]|nr:aldehyde dehydrogenase family protein [Armatimonadota bacterium]